jgi:hypothetical protein
MGKNLATVLLPWRITVNSISPALIGDTTFVLFPLPLHQGSPLPPLKAWDKSIQTTGRGWKSVFDMTAADHSILRMLE